MTTTFNPLSLISVLTPPRFRDSLHDLINSDFNTFKMINFNHRYVLSIILMILGKLLLKIKLGDLMMGSPFIFFLRIVNVKYFYKCDD